MLVYIIGEDVLNASDTLQKRWDNILTDDDLQEIINELN